MNDDGLLDHGFRLGESAKRRFVRWDPSVWDDILAGPLCVLAEGLAGSALPREQAMNVGRSYLELACEAVGLGYLFPTSTGRQNVFSLLWRTLIPRDLPTAPPERQAELLAACWNLGENLETSPPWLQRILLHACSSLDHLQHIEQAVASVHNRVLGAPSRPLGPSPRSFWVPVSDEDRRFLPGWSHFATPTVVCVHDRLRCSDSGRDVTCGILADDNPLVLGATGCELHAAEQERSPAPLDRFALHDPRVTPAWHVSVNPWRAAASLVSSQMVLVLCP